MPDMNALELAGTLRPNRQADGCPIIMPDGLPDVLHQLKFASRGEMDSGIDEVAPDPSKPQNWRNDPGWFEWALVA